MTQIKAVRYAYMLKFSPKIRLGMLKKHVFRSLQNAQTRTPF